MSCPKNCRVTLGSQENREVLENLKTSQKYILLVSLLPKMEIFFNTSKTIPKTEIELFPQFAISHENWSLSQYFVHNCRQVALQPWYLSSPCYCERHLQNLFKHQRWTVFRKQLKPESQQLFSQNASAGFQVCLFYYISFQGERDKGNTDALLTRFYYTKKLVKIYLQSVIIASAICH